MSAGADVAVLGLAVDSGPVKSATQDLQKMGDAAQGMEGKVKSAASATDALIGALNRNSAANTAQAQSLAAVTTALNSTLSALTAMVTQQTRVREAETQAAQATAKSAEGHLRLGVAVTAADTALARHVDSTRASVAVDVQATQAAETLTDKYVKLAAARQAASVEAAKVQPRVDLWSGVTQGAPKSAKDSAAAFSSGLGDREAETARLTAMRSALDPLWVSQERVNKVTADADELLSKGLITQQTYTNAVKAATKQHEDLAKATANSTRSAGLARHEWTNLSYQLNDVVTMGMMGASPMQIGTSQGGQILQTMQGSAGGITGALKGMGEGITGIVSKISPLAAGLGAMTIAVGLAATAFINFRSEQAALERSRFGAGAASGATVESMMKSATEAAAGGKVSASQARGMIGEMNTTGTINPDVYAKAADSAGRLAEKLKKDLPDAQAEVIAGLQPNIAGFDKLNKAYLLGDDNLRKQLDSMYESGRAFEAQAIVVDLLNKKLRDGETSSNFFVRGLKAIANTSMGPTSDPDLERLNNALSSQVTPQAQLQAARARLAAAQSAPTLPNGLGGPNPAGIATARQEVEKLETSLAKSAEDSAKAKTTLDNLTVGPLVTSLNPAQERIRNLTAQADAIEKSLNSGGRELDKDGSADRTMKALRAQAKQLGEELAQGGSSFADALQRAQFSQKTQGFGEYAKTRAQIEEDKRVEIEKVDAGNPESSKRAEQIATINEKYDTLLKTLDKSTIAAAQAASVNGGSYVKSLADAPKAMQDSILKSSASSGYSPDFISSIIWKESRYNNGLTSPRGAKGVGQFMPGTASDMGVDVNDVESSIMGIGKYLNALKKMTGLTSERDLAMAYNWGPGNMNDWVKGGRVGKVPAETTDYVNKIFGGNAGGTAANQKEIEERARAMGLERDQLKAVTDAGGKDVEGLAARIEVLNRVKAAQDANKEVTEEMIKQYAEEAKEKQKIATASRMVQYNVQTGFERDQIGRDRVDQQAYSQARSITGSVDFTTPRAQKIIQESRDNQGMLEAKNMTTEALTGFAGDLRRGAGFVTAFGNAMDRVADRLLNSALDSAVSGIFKGIQGAAAAPGGIMGLFGFANGGIMTNQGPLPLRTYARGGVANSPQLAMYGEAGPEAYVPLPDGRRIPVAMQGSKAGGGPVQGGSPVVVMNYTGQPVETKQTRGPMGPRTEVMVGKAVAGAAQSGELDNIMRSRFGVRPTGQ